jgi:hypothetical protein
LAHNLTRKKKDKLERKFLRLKEVINKLKSILERREKIWPEWERSLKEYSEKRNKERRFIVALLADLIKIPFQNVLLFTIDEIKENMVGHKSLQRKLRKYERLIEYADKYYEQLFSIKIPWEKIDF